MFFMKKIFITMCIILVLSTATKKTNYTDNDIIIPKESIRFRIIASSNEIADQIMKKNIKNQLQEQIFPLISSANNIVEARNKIKDNVDNFNSILSTYDIPYNISFGTNFFPEKSLYGINYAAGNYESLVITLGDGIGDNWWCVMFPPLCLLEAEENDTNNIEYKSFVKEMLSKYF